MDRQRRNHRQQRVRLLKRQKMRIRRKAAISIEIICNALVYVALGYICCLALLLAFIFDPYQPPEYEITVEANGMVYSQQDWEQLQNEKAAYDSQIAKKEKRESKLLQKVMKEHEDMESGTMKRSLDWSVDESRMMEKMAMAEAEGEDTEGKALVILVILNRVWSDEFPDTIQDVIFQDGAFESVANGRYDRVDPNEDCYAAMNLITTGQWDGSDGALYFERSSDQETWHSRNLQKLFTHGNHTFYKEYE